MPCGSGSVLVYSSALGVMYVCGSGAVTDMWEVFTQQLDMTFVSLGTFAVHGPHIKLFGDKGMEWIQAPCME